MNVLEKVTITGFWGNHDLLIDLNRDVNFLIGVNGSGKTTVINLIAAALSADFQTLDRIQFAKIVLQLKQVGGKKKPSIQIEKVPEPDSPFFGVRYKIKDKASDSAQTYSLGDLEEQYIIRGESSFRIYEPAFRHSYRDSIHRTKISVVEHLHSLINTKWLSVHRSDISRTVREERGYESTVDKKLGDLSNDFVKYFSSLTKHSEGETEKFQKFFFASLIPKGNEWRLSVNLASKLDLTVERKTLIEIYQKFKVEEKEYSRPLKEYIKHIGEAVKLIAKGKQLDTKQIISVISSWRIHRVVQQWSEMNESLKKIYEPRDTFLETVNGMLQRKNLFLNEKNELTVKTESGKTFPLTQLSSGEKQLLIILGEALLQEKASWIYIADEPELSLHVTWQEQLIKSLRKINPNAQILFATHSPDIVSIYGKNVFDMERYIK